MAANKKKIITVVNMILLVLTIGATCLFIFTRVREISGMAVEEKLFTLESSAYNDAVSSKQTEYPLLKTGLNNIYYAANPSGIIKFYEAANGEISEYSGEVKKIDSVVKCSRQSIPVSISYIKTDEGITGFGLFTTQNTQASKVYVYEYAFFKLVSLPSGYGKGDALLIVDYDKEDFYNDNKLFSDAFLFNLGSGKAEAVMGDIPRSVDLDGAYRNDWMLMEEDFLSSLGNQKWFLSSRDYTLDLLGKTSDLFTISSGVRRPEKIAGGFLGTYARVVEDGIVFLRQTDSGFSSVLLSNDTETVIDSFRGNYFESYIHSGDYVMHKSSLTLTNLITGEEKKISGIAVSAPTAFYLSPAEENIVITCNGIENEFGVPVQSMVYYSYTNKTGKVFKEPLLFTEETTAHWIDETTFIHFRPEKDDGTGLTLCTVEVNSIAEKVSKENKED